MMMMRPPNQQGFPRENQKKHANYQERPEQESGEHEFDAEPDTTRQCGLWLARRADPAGVVDAGAGDADGTLVATVSAAGHPIPPEADAA